MGGPCRGTVSRDRVQGPCRGTVSLGSAVRDFWPEQKSSSSPPKFFFLVAGLNEIGNTFVFSVRGLACVNRDIIHNPSDATLSLRSGAARRHRRSQFSR